MWKAKLCALTAATLLGATSQEFITANASEHNHNTTTVSESKDEKREQKSTFEDKMTLANDNWGKLTAKQKKEIYNLLEKEMKAHMKVMTQLVEYGVFNKSDIEQYQAMLNERYQTIVNNGEFPFAPPTRQRKSK